MEKTVIGGGVENNIKESDLVFPLFIDNDEDISDELITRIYSSGNIKWKMRFGPQTEEEVQQQSIRHIEQNKKDPFWVFKTTMTKEEYDEGIKNSGYNPKTDPMVLLAKELNTPEKLGKYVRDNQVEIEKNKEIEEIRKKEYAKKIRQEQINRIRKQGLIKRTK